MLGADVHEVNFCLGICVDFVTTTAVDTGVCKASVFIKRFVGLCHGVLIFFVCGHIDDFVSYLAGCFVNSAIRCFNEAILVDSCVC